jgi:hypothetical protein
VTGRAGEVSCGQQVWSDCFGSARDEHHDFSFNSKISNKFEFATFPNISFGARKNQIKYEIVEN